MDRRGHIPQGTVNEYIRVYLNGNVDVDVLPNVANTRDLGSQALYWAYVYTLRVWAPTTLSLQGMTGDVFITTVQADFISLSTTNTQRYHITATGHLVPQADNVYDYGDGATDARNIYFANSIRGKNALAPAGEPNGSIFFNNADNRLYYRDLGGVLRGPL